MQHSVSAPFPSAPRWEGREGDGGMSRKRPHSAMKQDSDEDEEPEDDVKWVPQCGAVAYVCVCIVPISILLDCGKMVGRRGIT